MGGFTDPGEGRAWVMQTVQGSTHMAVLWPWGCRQPRGQALTPPPPSPQALPPSGIHIFASQLHTHLTGRKVVTVLARDGREKEIVNRDNHYSPHFQVGPTTPHPFPAPPHPAGPRRAWLWAVRPSLSRRP